MTIIQSIDNFLATANLPDNLRNWGTGLKTVIGFVNDDRVTKTVLREVYNGANRASDSGRILNPGLWQAEKVVIQQVIDVTTDQELKNKMTVLLSEYEAWLNT
jgi:hypothetical protein